MATTPTTAPTPARKPLYTSLFVQVLTALLLGIVLGMAVPDFAVSLKIFSDAFLKLISMIVAPIVFCVVVHGIAGAGDLKKVGRVGVKALIYFEVMTQVALEVGIALAFNDVLQVLFFAVLFGISLALVGGEKGRQVTELIDAVATVLFRAMGLI